MAKITRIKRILVPVDFSKPSLSALRYAMALAKSQRARLEILHVVEAVTYAPMIGASVDLAPLREAQERGAGKRLATLQTQMRRQRVRGRAVLEVGSAASMIVDHAKKESVDLIVMATQGRGFVQHLLLGSVAERVVRGATCPVLTLRAGSRLARPKPRRVLVATDFSEASRGALDYAVDLAHSSSAELTVFHAVEPVAFSGDVYGLVASAAMFNEIERGAKEAITQLVSQLRKQKRGLRCKGVLFCGTAAMAIVDAAAKQSADVVVIGTHGHGGLVHLFLGSVAERVIRNSSRPVLTVHGGGAAAKASRKA